MKGCWIGALLVSCLFPLSLRAELPAGLTFDDGFTWVECHNFESIEDNVAVGRWVPEINVRILGTVPDRSGWKLVVKQDGKALGEYVNDGFPINLGNGHTKGMVIVGFWKDTPKLDVTGAVDLEV